MAMHANIFNVPRPQEVVSHASLLALPLNLLSLVISHVRYPAKLARTDRYSEADRVGSLTMWPILHDVLKSVASCTI
jgi:hypothetical protein